MKRVAYASALALGLVAASPWLIPRLARGRYRDIALARLGLGSAWLPPRDAGGAIWLHALSVGETGSALPLLAGLGKRFPNRPLALSVATGQGLAVAREQLAVKGIKAHLFVRPLDSPWAVYRLLDRLRPSLFCLVEGDIWPLWQWALAGRGVPRLLVNGRVSPRTFKNYRRMAKMARGLYMGFDHVLVQTRVDYDRLAAIGVEQSRLTVGGNLKFDSAPPELGQAERSALAQELGLEGRVVLAAGSTHEGEEDACLDAFAALGSGRPDLALLLAPREVGRGGELASMCAARGLSWARVSQSAPPAGTQVVILDVLGRLASAYALTRAAFVGGSLVPVGGHNLLEPAAQGVPVIFGPRTHNFLEMARDLEAAGGGLRIASGAELAQAWGGFLDNPGHVQETGGRALAFYRAHRGAVARVLDEAAALLGSA